MGETFRCNLGVVEQLRTFAADRGMSLPTLAVAWTLSNPAVDVAIVAARRPAHLNDSVAAADVDLTEGDGEQIDSVLAEHSPDRRCPIRRGPSGAGGTDRAP